MKDQLCKLRSIAQRRRLWVQPSSGSQSLQDEEGGSWGKEQTEHRETEIWEREKRREMGTTMAGLAPGLSRKLKKVLESRTDTPEVLGSLNTLSTFYTDNNPQNRRNLRSTIEKRSLSINIEFLRASDTAQQVLPVPIQLPITRLACLCSMSISPPIRRWIASRRRSMFLPIAAIGKTPLP